MIVCYWSVRGSKFLIQVQVGCGGDGGAYFEDSLNHGSIMRTRTYRLKFQYLLIDFRVMIGPYSKFC